MFTQYKLSVRSSFEIISRRKTFVLKETRYLESINVVDGIEHVVSRERGPPYYHGAYQSYDQAQQALLEAKDGFANAMAGYSESMHAAGIAHESGINEDHSIVHYTGKDGRKGSMSLRDIKAGMPPRFDGNAQ